MPAEGHEEEFKPDEEIEGSTGLTPKELLAAKNDKNYI
jgi:hypothetical protein